MTPPASDGWREEDPILPDHRIEIMAGESLLVETFLPPPKSRMVKLTLYGVAKFGNTVAPLAVYHVASDSDLLAEFDGGLSWVAGVKLEWI